MLNNQRGVVEKTDPGKQRDHNALRKRVNPHI